MARAGTPEQRVTQRKVWALRARIGTLDKKKGALLDQWRLLQKNCQHVYPGRSYTCAYCFHDCE